MSSNFSSTRTSRVSPGNNNKGSWGLKLRWFCYGFFSATCVLFQISAIYDVSMFSSGVSHFMTDVPRELPSYSATSNSNNNNKSDKTTTTTTTSSPRIRSTSPQNTDTRLSPTRKHALYQYHAPQPRSATRSSCGPSPAFASFFQLPMTNRSRLDEDQVIYRTFFQQQQHPTTTGRYVEMGAFDGVQESNTVFFDECLGWEGILIEPNPMVYPKLVQNRPHTHRLSYAASCSLQEEAQNKTVGFWRSIFTNAVQDDSVNREAYAGKPGANKVDVPCGSLTPVLLDLFPDGHVHFFSLDVEGKEPDVVQTIDFDRITIDVLISESENTFCEATSDCQARDRTRAYLADKGFTLYVGVVRKSDLYVRKGSPYQSALAHVQPYQLPSGTATSKASHVRLKVPKQSASTATTVSRWHKKYQYEAPVPRSDPVPSSVCGTAPGYDTFFALPMTNRSRLKEDKVIYEKFFRDLDRKTMKQFHYVEMGAFDGVQESNTVFFDECLGWEGILIEPNPMVYPKLVQNRPHAHRLSYAASCSLQEEAQNKTVGFWRSIFTNAVQDDSVNREAYAGKPGANKVDVPCGSLTPVLLDLFPDGHVHFFSLDVEGKEPDVVANIDFEKVFIHVLIAESFNTFCQGEDCVSLQETRKIMERHGFTLYSNVVKNSDLFVNKKSEFASKIVR